MPKESYDQLLDKARKAKEVFRASAGEFVPKMYEALRKEGVDEKDAWDKLEKDLVEIWELDTIRRYKPQVIKDKKKQAAAVKSHAVRNPAQIIQNADGSQEIHESPLVSTPSEPYGKGASEDREATRHEKQGFRIQELSQQVLQLQKENELLKEKPALDDAYVHQLKQKIKALEAENAELKKPFDAPTVIDFAGKILKGARAHVRPAHKEDPMVTVPEAVIPAGAF